MGVIQFMIDHYVAAAFIVNGILSEMLAIIQYFKFPENSGVGGVVVALLKIFAPLAPKGPGN